MAAPDDTDEALRTVANAEAARDADVASLPRLLRHALAALEGAVHPCIAAEIALMAPDLAADASRWASHPGAPCWRDLSGTLDDMAIEGDAPALHGVADSVRLASMTVADTQDDPGQALRLADGLEASKRVAGRAGATPESLADVERLSIGWRALATQPFVFSLSLARPAHRVAFEVGQDLTAAINGAAPPGDEGEGSQEHAEEADSGGDRPVPEGHVLVCPPLGPAAPSMASALRAHAHIVGVPLPLVVTPDLGAVRLALSGEYPHAVDAVDGVLAPLAGTSHVLMPPTLLVGPPGSGKSRLVRRLAETLGIGLWRTDGARAGCSSFGGTDRRWATAEASHALLAISRFGYANPAVLVDEVDKAGIDRRSGRLWDALLGHLEPETSRAYPDPLMQVDVDLSHISFLMTCNDVGDLPAALLDRCRIIEVPGPSARHLDLLLPSILRGIANDQRLDERWVEPLTESERTLVARRWRGGSIRALARLVAVVLRSRQPSLH